MKKLTLQVVALRDYNDEVLKIDGTKLLKDGLKTYSVKLPEDDKVPLDCAISSYAGVYVTRPDPLPQQ